MRLFYLFIFYFNILFSVEEDEPDQIRTTTSLPLNSNNLENNEETNDHAALNGSTDTFQSTTHTKTNSPQWKLSKIEISVFSYRKKMINHHSSPSPYN